VKRSFLWWSSYLRRGPKLSDKDAEVEALANLFHRTIGVVLYKLGNIQSVAPEGGTDGATPQRWIQQFGENSKIGVLPFEKHALRFVPIHPGCE
jgi:hypothetical protein